MADYIIDASNLVLGRLASFAAKKTLLGENIKIVNCEKAVITGSKATVIAHYKRKRARGTWSGGPHFPKSPEMVVKRTIRGMLPYKRERGREAFGRVRCYAGIPEELAGKKLKTIKEADISKVPNIKYVALSEICRQLGAKI